MKKSRLKRQASKQLLLGISMFTLATIPVVLQLGNGDHTGSLFLWIMSSIAIYDSVKALIKLNRG